MDVIFMAKLHIQILPPLFMYQVRLMNMDGLNFPKQNLLKMVANMMIVWQLIHHGGVVEA